MGLFYLQEQPVMTSWIVLWYFVGYPSKSLGYLCYYPSNIKIIILRNTIFLEQEFLIDRKEMIVELEEVWEPQTEIQPELNEEEQIVSPNVPQPRTVDPKGLVKNKVGCSS